MTSTLCVPVYLFPNCMEAANSGTQEPFGKKWLTPLPLSTSKDKIVFYINSNEPKKDKSIGPCLTSIHYTLCQSLAALNTHAAVLWLLHHFQYLTHNVLNSLKKLHRAFASFLLLHAYICSLNDTFISTDVLNSQWKAITLHGEPWPTRQRFLCIMTT